VTTVIVLCRICLGNGDLNLGMDWRNVFHDRTMPGWNPYIFEGDFLGVTTSRSMMLPSFS